jgi:hypothetical protein
MATKKSRMFYRRAFVYDEGDPQYVDLMYDWNGSLCFQATEMPSRVDSNAWDDLYAIAVHGSVVGHYALVLVVL